MLDETESDHFMRGEVPRGECLTGPDCSYAACEELSDYVTDAAMHARYEGRAGSLLEIEDPEELINLPVTSWPRAQLAYDRAFELFAAQGDIASAIWAAEHLTAAEPTINRLFHLLPHTDDVYLAARRIANIQPTPQARVAINRLIDTHWRLDVENEHWAILASITQYFRQRRAAQAVTIITHGGDLISVQLSSL